jgi:hypothetical protein
MKKSLLVCALLAVSLTTFAQKKPVKPVVKPTKKEVVKEPVVVKEEPKKMPEKVIIYTDTPIIYAGILNKIDIHVDNIGREDYKRLSFKVDASLGEVVGRISPERAYIEIYAFREGEIKLEILYENQSITSKVFEVLPEANSELISTYEVDGKPSSDLVYLSGNMMSITPEAFKQLSIKMAIKPDAHFAKTSPNECVYTLSTYDIVVKRGDKVIFRKNESSFDMLKADLAEVGSKAKIKLGDYVFIQDVVATRKNAKGDNTDAKLRSRSFGIHIVNAKELEEMK